MAKTRPGVNLLEQHIDPTALTAVGVDVLLGLLRFIRLARADVSKYRRSPDRSPRGPRGPTTISLSSWRSSVIAKPG